LGVVCGDDGSQWWLRVYIKAVVSVGVRSRNTTLLICGRHSTIATHSPAKNLMVNDELMINVNVNYQDLF